MHRHVYTLPRVSWTRVCAGIKKATFDEEDANICDRMVRHDRTFRQITRHVQATLRRERLLPRGEGILVAISGGQDSLTLTETLLDLHSRAPWRSLTLCHVHHGWEHDFQTPPHVSAYAERRGIKLDIVGPPHVAPCTEGGAREWRYAHLLRAARRVGAQAVVTGHTMTDLAETVVLAALRGCGAEGLSSLTWSRRLGDDISLVRPLLGVSRADTAAVCAELGVDVCEDVYNEDVRFARNRVRKCVMPVLKQHVSRHAEVMLAQTAHILAGEAAHMRDVAEGAFERGVCVRDCGGGMREVLLDRRVLCKESVAVRRRVVRLALQKYVGLSARGATFQQVEAVCALLQARVGAACASLACHAAARVISDDCVAICVKVSYVKDREQDCSFLEGLS